MNDAEHNARDNFESQKAEGHKSQRPRRFKPAPPDDLKPAAPRLFHELSDPWNDRDL